MRYSLMWVVGMMALACGGAEGPSAVEVTPEPVGTCPDWLPLTGQATVEPTGWTLPTPEGIELVDRTSNALTQYSWDQPYPQGVATFQFLFSSIPPERPLDAWTSTQGEQQENLGRTIENTTVDLDGTSFTAIRYAQGFTHGIEVAIEQPGGGFRSVTLDLQGSDADCAAQARETLDAILDGITLP